MKYLIYLLFFLACRIFRYARINVKEFIIKKRGGIAFSD
jgi:phosphatidylserine synthase